jgi:predicted dehydrogenase
MSLDQNWGVLGYGAASKNFCFSFKEESNIKLYGIASVSKFNDINKLNKIKCKKYNNYDDLINDPKINIIYVGTANFLHFECLKKIVNSGKNILVEKPSCLKFEELNSLTNLIKEKKIYFKESILYLSHPLAEIIRKMVNNNEIGKVYEIRTKFGFNFNKKKFFFFKKKKNNNLFSKIKGGGAIYNYGHYPLSTLFAFFNHIKTPKIINIDNNSNLIDGVEAHCKTTLNFDIGLSIKSEISLIKNLNSFVEILGERGSIYVDNPWLPNEFFTIIKNNKKNRREYKFQEKQSLLELEKKNIYDDYLNFADEPSVKGADLKSSLMYLKYIDQWKNKVYENI